jgi:hypothetical protein
MSVYTGSFNFQQLCEFKPGLKEQIFDFISSLPQADAIKEEDAKAWLEKTASLTVRADNESAAIPQAIEQLWWHLKRLNGIGGSDIGDVISYRVGETPGFNTPDELFRAKRMIDAPTNGDNYTRRGTLLEPILGRLLIEDYELERSEETIAQVYANSGKVPGYEFLVGNIDDAVRDVDGDIYIVDYKAPTDVPTEPPFAYVAQLHHYDIILNNGERGDNQLADAFFNYSKGELTVHLVHKDEELIDQIKQFGREFWDCVCDPKIEQLPAVWMDSGEVIEGEMSEDDSKLVPEIEAKLKAVRVLEEMLAKAKGELAVLAEKTLTSDYGIKSGAKDVSKDLTARVSLKIKEELKLVSLLEHKGIDPETLKKESASFDKEAVTAFIIDHGGNPDDFKSKSFDGVKVLKVLREIGVDPSIFIEKSASIYPKSSKAVKESTEEIRSAIDEEFEATIQKMLDVAYECQSQEADMRN